MQNCNIIAYIVLDKELGQNGIRKRKEMTNLHQQGTRAWACSHCWYRNYNSFMSKKTCYMNETKHQCRTSARGKQPSTRGGQRSYASGNKCIAKKSKHKSAHKQHPPSIKKVFTDNERCSIATTRHDCAWRRPGCIGRISKDKWRPIKKKKWPWHPHKTTMHCHA